MEKLSETLLAFIDRYNQTAKPLNWKYTADDLKELLRRLSEHENARAWRRARSPVERRKPEIRHCRHCAGNCPGDCLLGDGQCIHGWNEHRPPLTWQALLTRRWWHRVLWGQH